MGFRNRDTGTALAFVQNKRHSGVSKGHGLETPDQWGEGHMLKNSELKSTTQYFWDTYMDCCCVESWAAYICAARALPRVERPD